MLTPESLIIVKSLNVPIDRRTIVKVSKTIAYDDTGTKWKRKPNKNGMHFKIGDPSREYGNRERFFAVPDNPRDKMVLDRICRFKSAANIIAKWHSSFVRASEADYPDNLVALADTIILLDNQHG